MNHIRSILGQTFHQYYLQFDYLQFDYGFLDCMGSLGELIYDDRFARKMNKFYFGY